MLVMVLTVMGGSIEYYLLCMRYTGQADFGCERFFWVRELGERIWVRETWAEEFV